MNPAIEPNDSLLLVIDIQEKFRLVINEFDRVVDNSKKLIKASNLLNIPIIVTEQYPGGLGETVEEIHKVLEVFGDVKKVSFNCFNNSDFVDLIRKEAKKNIIISGIESHVCDIQTAIAALAKGYNVCLVADAVSSRKISDYEVALRRMENEGVKLASTEMIIFQMIKDSKDEKFKELSNIIK